jgi:class 3 adenylate cyclase
VIKRQQPTNALPRGTLTFLFTDIQGSTQLLRQLGDDYPPLLQRHQVILRAAVRENVGVEVHSEGDGFMFVFSSARSALTAAVQGQLALQAEPWFDGVSLLVRMGLHTGDAVPEGGDYQNLSVHQAARISDAAYGGQILVSQVTAAALSEALPPSTTLDDLGKFLLKDFDTPTRMFQVCHPELLHEFDAARVEPAPSPVAPSGTFRAPGDIHVHIDGCRDPAEVFRLLDHSERGRVGPVRFPRKYNHILRFTGGPQREDKAFAETYRYHTPGSLQKELFNSFSTVLLGAGRELGPEAVETLATILEAISDQPQAVVELERVIGVLEEGGDWHEADEARVAEPTSLHAPELARFRRLTSSGIEVHHSIDFPKDPTEVDEPLAVDQLPTWPNLGGWFLFDKGTSWSYRSSEFVDRSAEYHYAVCVGQRRLSEYLGGLGLDYTLRTLVEQVLGLWRGGPQPVDSSRSIPALGEWEMSAPPDGHVWVIAANFLGDSSPDVNRAMLQNLGEGVTYTYFLRTHADVLRLGLLKESLEHSLIADGASTDRARRIVADHIGCVLLSPELGVDDTLKRLLKFDYFLCPFDRDMGGYRLESSGLSGERISPQDAAYLVEALNPLLDAKIRGLFSSPEETWQAQSSYQAVVCTDLEESAVDQDQESWSAMLAAYDRIVAREVSMHGVACSVVRPVRNGYLMVFEAPKHAAAWAKRLQFEVQWHNEQVMRNPGRGLVIPTHNVALGYGPVSRVLRAHGYDCIGGAIDDCIELAAKLRGGMVGMSPKFADQYEGQVGKKEFVAGVEDGADPRLGPLKVLQWP